MIVSFFIAAAALGVGYVLCGFVFDGHFWMGDMPVILFVFGLGVALICSWFGMFRTLIFTALGYVLSFAVSKIFTWEDYRLAPDGEFHIFDISWVVWAVAFLMFIGLGLIFDFVKRKRRVY